MFKRKQIAMVLGMTLAAAGVVWACGPDFPSQLLDHRAATLKATPQNSFAWEAQHLLVATDALQVHEASASPYDEAPKKTDDAASRGLTAAQLTRVTALRALPDAGQAYEQGKDLPEDLRLYTAGAVDFAAAIGPCAPPDKTAAASNDCPGLDGSSADSASMDKAIDRFEKILALPADQATLRSVWAAYTLGRIHAARAETNVADPAAFRRERDAAAKAFEIARARAVAGASDTQGLAVASFGEEARLYLYSGATHCAWADLRDASKDCGDGIAPADLKHAITLYAAQAGHGSDSAVQSLATLAGNVLRNDQRAAALIDGPVSQRLLVAYALARMGGDTTYDDVTGAPQPAKADPVLPALVQAIDKQGIDHVASADRLAALAYRNGQYDLARTLADKSSGPLSSWVKAKLALQKGDLAAAAAAYAQAAEAFPQNNDPKAAIEPSNANLIIGEQGVLALARGEYVQAMGHLYDAAARVGGSGDVYDDEGGGVGYGDDVAQIAERVLTLDELKDFVDAHAPASPVPAQKADPDRSIGSAPLADNVRWLLARRLMRARRYDEAQNYFPASGDARFGAVDLRAKARDYAQALHDADHAWTDIGKAQARYAAAVIARENGMELLGYEQDPDYNVYGGGYPGDYDYNVKRLKQDFVTDGERQRSAQSAAAPDLRFHYRYIAADDASAAADLLPPRSQAFAAVLCKAAHWMREGPPDYHDHYQNYGEPKLTGPSEAQRRVGLYYQRYVTQGAYVEWADNFGEACQAPDFDRARSLLKHQRIVRARHFIRRYLPYEIAGFVLVVGGLTAWIVRRRRRRAPA
jgi:hypothetical protein